MSLKYSSRAALRNADARPLPRPRQRKDGGQSARRSDGRCAV